MRCLLKDKSVTTTEKLLNMGVSMATKGDILEAIRTIKKNCKASTAKDYMLALLDRDCMQGVKSNLIEESIVKNHVMSEITLSHDVVSFDEIFTEDISPALTRFFLRDHVTEIDQYDQSTTFYTHEYIDNFVYNYAELMRRHSNVLFVTKCSSIFPALLAAKMRDAKIYKPIRVKYLGQIPRTDRRHYSIGVNAGTNDYYGMLNKIVYEVALQDLDISRGYILPGEDLVVLDSGVSLNDLHRLVGYISEGDRREFPAIILHPESTETSDADIKNGWNITISTYYDSKSAIAKHHPVFRRFIADNDCNFHYMETGCSYGPHSSIRHYNMPPSLGSDNIRLTTPFCAITAMMANGILHQIARQLYGLEDISAFNDLHFEDFMRYKGCANVNTILQVIFTLLSINGQKPVLGTFKAKCEEPTDNG